MSTVALGCFIDSRHYVIDVSVLQHRMIRKPDATRAMRRHTALRKNAGSEDIGASGHRGIGTSGYQDIAESLHPACAFDWYFSLPLMTRPSARRALVDALALQPAAQDTACRKEAGTERPRHRDVLRCRGHRGQAIRSSHQVKPSGQAIRSSHQVKPSGRAVGR